MSIIALQSAFKHIQTTPMSAPARLVILALANRHNQETGRCDPSNTKLQGDTQLTERTVRKAIRELEKLGIIETVERTKRTGRGKTNMTNRYRINRGVQYAGRGGSNMPPKQEYRKPSAFDDLAMGIEVVDYLNPHPQFQAPRSPLPDDECDLDFLKNDFSVSGRGNPAASDQEER
ncbi:helix-turn-helix domain-containing protein [Thalassobius sp. Cn5-15]|uniref:helix-turn-helix domain-containing protein n=1 Tax=Thalassobius sp. Cn5-15 TaxID=2917763 RepID=UPI001EF37E38|nr:helix-turn-helix domain-containing protein [Thalassobius sp. Cn5-15]MCG7492450.1 helix-turn-helix domain-containing protein [Thalassobius sp. Cn5-15]